MVQRVLITAGAGGIGLATAKAFSEQGARIHIADINADAVKAAVDSIPNVTGTVADLSKPEDIDRVFEDVARELGGLDTLVNNAGIAGPTSPITEYPDADFDMVLSINLRATFGVTKRAVPLLKESSMASIITMSSVAGRYGYPNRVGYSTTKFALVGFAKSLAIELGEFGITSNTIHPGAVNGPRMEKVLEGRAALSGKSVEEERENALKNQSIKGFVDAEDIAQLILFVSGPHARKISGQALPIDGDSKAAV
jgi:NAD(P)-dependent dehydrogenase (short-subunit alcohol dehydrogenase family)